MSQEDHQRKRVKIERTEMVFSRFHPTCRYHLHVIIDEIYMLTVFDEAITFHSVLSIER